MLPYISHAIHDNRFLVLPERCLFWENEQALILSDLHLGKSGHFRKNGIAIPQSVFKNDMHRLFSVIQHFKPTSLIIVGDFFHSHANLENDFFSRWRNDIARVQINLVMGNHDILHKNWYHQNGIHVYRSKLEINSFCFSHELSGAPADNNQYSFSGHIHPGIRISGAGKQAIQLPCFYFGKSHAILPAFGGFTGTVPIRLSKGETVYALTGKEVIKL